MFWSATAPAHSSGSTSYRRDYDEGVPQAFICPISQEIMEHPMSVNCGEGHTFEKGEIENWMQRESTCPEDRHAITEIYPNRPLRNMIQEWKREHAIEEIDSEQLAFYILFPDQIPGEAKEERHVRLAAYLRFAQVVRKTEEVATEIVRISNDREVAIPEIHKKNRPHTLDERAWRILNGIVREANTQQSGRLSPRTARLMKGFDQMRIRSERAEEASRKRYERCEARMDQLVRYHEEEADRVREDVEARRRPLSAMEVGGAILSVVGPAAACAIGRGVGGICDTDAATTFLSEASRFGSLDMIQTGLQAANLGYAWQTRGNEGIRRVNDNLLGNLCYSAALGAREYEATMGQDATRIERESYQQEQKKMQELQDRLARGENGIQDVGGRIGVMTERIDEVNGLADEAVLRSKWAQEKADEAYAHGHEAYEYSDRAYKLAQTAETGANTAQKRANEAYAHGHEAYERSDVAFKLAQTAETGANRAQKRAEEAYKRGNEAYSRGDDAYTLAERLKSGYVSAQGTCNQASGDVRAMQARLEALERKASCSCVVM